MEKRGLKGLRQLMERDGVTRKDLAWGLQRSKRTISRYISGDCSASLDQLVWMATYFDVPVDVLVNGYED